MLTEDSIIEYKHTSIILFMALDLLFENGLAGKIKHIYTYNMKSLLWIFLWTCPHYHNGKLHES